MNRRAPLSGFVSVLHPLDLSRHRERFVLKWAMRLVTWFDEPHRATWTCSDPATPIHDAPVDVFREGMDMAIDDGVGFDATWSRSANS